MGSRMAAWGTVLLLLLTFGGQAAAGPLDVAIFGDNDGFRDHINSLGYNGTFVTDAQVATAGFLSNFGAFAYTRNDGSFGSPLSAAASANVAAYVGPFGNVVLFNSDIFDELSFPTPTTPNTQVLIANAVGFATSSGHGFIGEFRGATAALTANGDGYTPLGLITGVAGSMQGGGGDSGSSMNLTAAGSGHAVTAGVAFPYNPGEVEFGAEITGVDANLVLAVYDSGNPAIIARGAAVAAVPEPGSFTLLGLGVLGTACYARRRRKMIAA
jgi:hypothetical protein